MLSKLLSIRENREFVIRLVQTRNVPEGKFAGDLSELSSGDSLLKTLEAGKFVSRETIIECRRTNQGLGRFSSDDVDINTLSIRCPQCNRLYRDEKFYTANVPTDRLRKLIESSRWMSIIVTFDLVEAGIPKDLIFWNTTFGTDEIDIVAFASGSLFIFELKDREFSASDAHHFNYRRSLTKPAEAFVVTASTVSPDARRVFEDVSGEKGSYSSVSSTETKLPNPIIIEGLNNTKQILAEKVRLHCNVEAMLAIRAALGGLNSRIEDTLMQHIFFRFEH